MKVLCNIALLSDSMFVQSHLNRNIDDNDIMFKFNPNKSAL